LGLVGDVDGYPTRVLYHIDLAISKRFGVKWFVLFEKRVVTGVFGWGGFWCHRGYVVEGVGVRGAGFGGAWK
jgi:hypothetical protein